MPTHQEIICAVIAELRETRMQNSIQNPQEMLDGVELIGSRSSAAIKERGVILNSVTNTMLRLGSTINVKTLSEDAMGLNLNCDEEAHTTQHQPTVENNISLHNLLDYSYVISLDRAIEVDRATLIFKTRENYLAFAKYYTEIVILEGIIRNGVEKFCATKYLPHKQTMQEFRLFKSMKNSIDLNCSYLCEMVKETSLYHNKYKDLLYLQESVANALLEQNSFQYVIMLFLNR